MIPLWWHRDIGPGDAGSDVDVVQRLLLCHPTGVLDASTVAAVRGFQVACGLQAHGWVDDDTAEALGARAADNLLPEWWEGQDISPGDEGYLAAVGLLGGEPALRRFQGNYGLPATGVIDADTARLLGALA